MKARYLAVGLVLSVIVCSLSGCNTDISTVKDDIMQKFSKTEEVSVTGTTEIPVETVSIEFEPEDEVAEEINTVTYEVTSPGASVISNDEVSQPGEVQTVEESSEYSEPEPVPEEQPKKKKPKKTLSDVFLANVYIHPSNEENSGYEEYANENGEYAEENINIEDGTETEVNRDWDASVYQSLGVHAPKLDDWYAYKCSNITQKGDIFEYTEVGIDDMNKTVTVQFSANKLEVSEEYEGASSVEEVLGSDCPSVFDDGKLHGEVIIKDDNCYCKLITEAIDRNEFIEIAKHFKSYM